MTPAPARWLCERWPGGKAFAIALGERGCDRCKPEFIGGLAAAGSVGRRPAICVSAVLQFVRCHPQPGPAEPSHAITRGRPSRARREIGEGPQPIRFVTASLKVDFKQPTPLGVELVVTGKLRSLEGRKAWIFTGRSQSSAQTDSVMSALKDRGPIFGLPSSMQSATSDDGSPPRSPSHREAPGCSRWHPASPLVALIRGKGAAVIGTTIS